MSFAGQHLLRANRGLRPALSCWAQIGHGEMHSKHPFEFGAHAWSVLHPSPHGSSGLPLIRAIVSRSCSICTWIPTNQPPHRADGGPVEYTATVG